MLRLDDDGAAARLWDGAAGLALASWRDYASNLVHWVLSDRAERHAGLRRRFPGHGGVAVEIR